MTPSRLPNRVGQGIIVKRRECVSIVRGTTTGNTVELGWGFSIALLPSWEVFSGLRHQSAFKAPSSRGRGMALGSRDNAGDASPSETSPLLAKAYGKTRDGGLTIVPNEPIEEPVGDDGRIGDEEAPEMGQAPNPLMEGLPEVAAKMYILLPAVGIGVSIRMLLSMCYKSNEAHRFSSLRWTRPSSSLRTPRLAAR